MLYWELKEQGFSTDAIRKNCKTIEELVERGGFYTVVEFFKYCKTRKKFDLAMSKARKIFISVFDPQYIWEQVQKIGTEIPTTEIPTIVGELNKREIYSKTGKTWNYQTFSLFLRENGFKITKNKKQKQEKKYKYLYLHDIFLENRKSFRSYGCFRKFLNENGILNKKGRAWNRQLLEKIIKKMDWLDWSLFDISLDLQDLLQQSQEYQYLLNGLMERGHGMQRSKKAILDLNLGLSVSQKTTLKHMEICENIVRLKHSNPTITHNDLWNELAKLNLVRADVSNKSGRVYQFITLYMPIYEKQKKE